MEENLNTEGKILEILGDLELPLLIPVRKSEEGYEVMVDLTGMKRLNKLQFCDACHKRNLKADEICIFRDGKETYAAFLINPETTEV